MQASPCKNLNPMKTRFKDWCDFHFNGIINFAQRVLLAAAVAIASITACVTIPH